MVAQFVEDFVHFKCGENGFDEDRCTNAALRNPQLLLREHKDIVPQPRLEMAFKLRQIKVRSSSSRKQFFGVVKKVQAKVKKRSGHGLAVDQKMVFVEMPSTRTNK